MSFDSTTNRNFKNNTNFKTGATKLQLATGVLMGWRYGVKRIMSSYDFENADKGPPTQSLPSEWFNATILPPTTSAGSSDLANINYDQDRDVYFGCDNGWICEHRWPGTDLYMYLLFSLIGSASDNWGCTKKSNKEFETWVGCLLQWPVATRPLMQVLPAMDATSGSDGMITETILKNEMWLLFNPETDLLLSKTTISK